MDMEKMTASVQEALGQAQQIAVARHHQQIGVPHLWTVFLQPGHFVQQLYQDVQVDTEKLAETVAKQLDAIAEV